MNAFGLLDLAQWSALVGFFFPLAAALIKQDGFSSRTNAVLSLILAVIVAVVTTAVNGDLSWERWGTSLIALYTVAVATYQGIWTKVGERALKSATSVVKADSGPDTVGPVATGRLGS